MGAAIDIEMGDRMIEVEVPSDQGTGTSTCYVPCKLLKSRFDEVADNNRR